jgi:cell division protein FtsW
MMSFARTDTSVLANWWWTVDRWSLAAIAALMGFGILLTLAASPAVAERIGYDSYYFVKRQLIYLGPAVITVIACSLLETRGVRRVAVILFMASLIGIRGPGNQGRATLDQSRWTFHTALGIDEAHIRHSRGLDDEHGQTR